MITTKTLRLKKQATTGAYIGRPFWETRVYLIKLEDGAWELNVTVDGEARPVQTFPRRIDALNAVAAIGKETVMTRNILNPKAGEFPIARRDYGSCCDPGTETYHCM